MRVKLEPLGCVVRIILTWPPDDPEAMKAIHSDFTAWLAEKTATWALSEPVVEPGVRFSIGIVSDDPDIEVMTAVKAWFDEHAPSRRRPTT